MDTVTPLPVLATEVAPPLDYYLILPEAPSGMAAHGPAGHGMAAHSPAGHGTAAHDTAARPDGIVVEEFVLAEDFSAIGLHSTGWTPAQVRDSAGPSGAAWWSSRALSRGMRVDPALRARVVPVGRDDAEAAYRRLGGGDLPDETTLRTHFDDYEPLADSAPLHLGSDDVPDGFADKRVYRILFAKELSADRLANLVRLWRLAPVDDPTDPRARVLGTASRHVSDDVFTWDLRRIGAAVAWCVDLTAYLRDSSGSGIGPMLRELRTDMRRQGLIPVTVERFS